MLYGSRNTSGRSTRAFPGGLPNLQYTANACTAPRAGTSGQRTVNSEQLELQISSAAADGTCGVLEYRIALVFGPRNVRLYGSAKAPNGRLHGCEMGPNVRL